VGSLSPQHGASSSCERRNGLQLWRLNKQPQTNNKGWSSSLGFELGANNPSPYKNKRVTKSSKEPRTWTNSLDKKPKRQNIYMRFGTWNVILERWDRVVWTGLVWLRIGTGEYGNEPSGSIKCWETIEWLHN
jgi:hypothetical protein